MNDSTAVKIAAGRVRRGDITGALALLVRQGALCPRCERTHPDRSERDCDAVLIGATP